ncbi:hypothetical protein EM308_02050 [Flavobacterium gilvum]|uniref:Uncharacterized protein n=1 Tax=Flavobacterium gilvum TaxID=1492737 RepID=A0AAC9N641_9FLAO|nr:hypothetical protein EM308_02050 [Flavobacterium gilvum]
MKIILKKVTICYENAIKNLKYSSDFSKYVSGTQKIESGFPKLTLGNCFYFECPILLGVAQEIVRQKKLVRGRINVFYIWKKMYIGF